MQVAAEHRQGRIQIDRLQQGQHDFPGAVARMPLQGHVEADGSEAFEIGPCREHIGAQEPADPVLGLVDEHHIGTIVTGAWQFVLGGDREVGHGAAQASLQLVFPL